MDRFIFLSVLVANKCEINEAKNEKYIKRPNKKVKRKRTAYIALQFYKNLFKK
jgi:hypothetical protein